MIGDHGPTTTTPACIGRFAMAKLIGGANKRWPCCVRSPACARCVHRCVIDRCMRERRSHHMSVCYSPPSQPFSGTARCSFAPSAAPANSYLSELEKEVSSCLIVSSRPTYYNAAPSSIITAPSAPRCINELRAWSVLSAQRDAGRPWVTVRGRCEKYRKEQQSCVADIGTLDGTFGPHYVVDARGRPPVAPLVCGPGLACTGPDFFVLPNTCVRVRPPRVCYQVLCATTTLRLLRRIESRILCTAPGLAAAHHLLRACSAAEGPSIFILMKRGCCPRAPPRRNDADDRSVARLATACLKLYSFCARNPSVA